jgi:glycosyltransferase involved in cell wall biosynthesis
LLSVINLRRDSNLADPTISVVIATKGRPTLRSTIESIKAQPLVKGDEVLIAIDGPFPQAIELAREAGPPFRWIQAEKNIGYWGHGIRNWVFDHQASGENARLRGDLVAAMDDDNIFTPWAFDSVRAAAVKNPGKPLLFRVVTIPGIIIWDSPVVSVNNVDTASLVCPNILEKIGRFRMSFGGDYHFVSSTIENFGGSVSFQEEIICICRPAPDLDIAKYQSL